MNDENQAKDSNISGLSDYEKSRRENFAKIIVGGTDTVGNKIFSVYAKGDEFAIYSTDENHSIKNIRVRIETIIPDDIRPINNFQDVKIEFDKLKSLSNRCDDPSYAARVAHALSVAIYGETAKAKKILEEISEHIIKEYQEKVIGKLVYMTGTYSISFLLSIIAICSYLTRDDFLALNNRDLYELIMVCTFSTYGGVISVSRNINKIVVDKGLGKFPYFLYGAGRSIFSILGGIFILLVIKSNLFFGFINNLTNPIYGLCALGYVAGFSETFVPNTLKKLEEKADKKT